MEKGGKCKLLKEKHRNNQIPNGMTRKEKVLEKFVHNNFILDINNILNTKKI
jgi:hypothetical protein